MRFLIRPNRWLTAVSLAIYALGNVLATFSHNHGGTGSCCHGDVCEHAAPAKQHEAEQAHTHCHHGHTHAAATCSHRHVHKAEQEKKTPAPGETWLSEPGSDSVGTICLACQFLAQKALAVAVAQCEDRNDLWVGREAASERLNLHRLPLAFTARGPPSLV
jgi:hypothetical protein